MRLTAMCILWAATILALPDPAKADKSYRVTLTNISKAGSIELQPGDYNLVLDKSKVLFTEAKTGKVFELEAKVDGTAARRFKTTAVESVVTQGIRVIKEIQLGGTTTKLAFP